MRIYNVLDGRLGFDDDPGKYRAAFTKAGEEIGAQLLGASVVLLEPGQAVCPYHYELVEEEWLFVLEGTPSVRTPAGVDALSAGELICFPRGAGGAHQIFNSAAEPARVFIISERALCAATVYEDSDKIGVFGPGVRHLFRRSDERDYFDGEAT